MDTDEALLSALALLAKTAPSEGEATAYLVGGAVRDILLGRRIHEADIVVAGNAELFVAQATRLLHTRAVALSGRFRIWRLPVGATYIDVAPMQGTIEQDLGRRDFTVNAMAVPLARVAAWRANDSGAGLREWVIDLHGGQSDLARRVLRLTGAEAFRDDPVRLLRCVRLACELGFEIERETQRQQRRDANELNRSSAERVGTELHRLFQSPLAARGLRAMDECGLLVVCFPELEAGRDVEQRPVHQHPVLEHELVATGWLEVLLAAQPPESPAEWAVWQGLWNGVDWRDSQWGPVAAHLERNAAVLRAATLFHDVGKPQTRTVEEDGRTRFFGHAELGAEVAAAALDRWHFSRLFGERVGLLIREHLRPGQVGSTGALPTAKAIHRFQRELGDATPDVCWLFLADSLATVGAEALLPRWPAYVSHVHRLVTWTRPESAQRVHQLIDGHAVMAATGISSGPLVGRILAAIEDAAAASEINSADEALALAVRMVGASANATHDG